MTKNFKLVLSLALAIMMLMVSCVAFADTYTETNLSAAGETKVDNGNFTVTITKNSSDKATHTYEAYQIFKGDLNIKEESGVKTRTLSNIQWGNGVNTSEANLTTLAATLNALRDATTPEYTTALTKDSTAAEFAAAIGKLATGFDAVNAQKIAEAFDAMLSSTTSGTSGDTSVSGLNAGYYLIKDQNGSLASATDGAYTRLILQVVSNVTSTEKADVPSAEKKVKEDSEDTAVQTSSLKGNLAYDAGYQDTADYDIGQTIPFEVRGTVANNYGDYEVYYYAFVDTFSTGLTYDTEAGVTVEYYDATASEWKTISAEHYTVTNPTSANGNKLTIEFPIKKESDTYTEKGLKDVGDVIKADTVIRARYNAVLNDQAAVGAAGNINEVHIEFSNNPNKGGEGDKGKSEDDKVIVFTFEIDATKYIDEIGTGHLATNGTAKFILTTADGSKMLKKRTSTSGKTKDAEWIDAVGAPTAANDLADAGTYYSNAGVEVFTIDANAQIKIEGLDEGTYIVKEIVAPAGYNAVDTTITIAANNPTEWTSGNAANALPKFTYTVDEVTYTQDASLTEDNAAEHKTKTVTGKASADILNLPGTVLPSTGGIGTTIFYVAGSIMVLAAAILLITKRRMGVND